MNHIYAPLLAVFTIVATRAAPQSPEPFCDGSRFPCVPDSLEVAFPPDDSPVDEGNGVTDHIVRVGGSGRVNVGGRFRVRVIFDAKSRRIQGWSYAVRHDPDVATIQVDTVTTAGTRADPAHRDQIALQPMFDATLAVRELDDDPRRGPFVGFISAVVLSLLADTQLPANSRHAICNAEYVLDRAPARDSRIRFVDGELGAPNSPAVDINLTINGATWLPETLVNAVLRASSTAPEICDNGDDDNSDGLVDCADPQCHSPPTSVPPCGSEDSAQRCGDGIDNDGDGNTDCDDDDCPTPPCEGCPSWGFFFGPDTREVFEVSPEDESVEIAMRNTRPAGAFSLGVKQDGGRWEFSEGLASNEGLPVELLIVDARGESHQPAPGNTAEMGGRSPAVIERGAAIAAFRFHDFFAYDLDPSVGGPGFVVGYVADLESEERVVPAGPGGEECGLQPILVVRFDVPAGRQRFERGDINGDGRVEISDAVLVLRSFFGGIESRFDCEDRFDANDDNRVSFSDGLALLVWKFQDGPPLPAPFLGCGTDDEEGTLGCNEPSPACDG